jgi:hypothetical protein
MPAALGWRTKFGIGPTFPVTTQLEFQEERLRFQEVQSDLSGLRGTRGRPDARVRTTAGQPSGPIILQPTPRELDVVLKYILGGEKEGDTFPLAE